MQRFRLIHNRPTSTFSPDPPPPKKKYTMSVTRGAKPRRFRQNPSDLGTKTEFSDEGRGGGGGVSSAGVEGEEKRLVRNRLRAEYNAPLQFRRIIISAILTARYTPTIFYFERRQRHDKSYRRDVKTQKARFSPNLSLESLISSHIFNL